MPRVVDLYDAASYHALVCRTEHKSDRTIKLYLGYEQRFLDFLHERKMAAGLDALNLVTVRQAILWQQRHPRGKRGGSVAVKMFAVTMKVWSKFLHREGVLTVDPLASLKNPATLDAERQPYTQSEVLAMLEATRASRTPLRDRLLIHLLLDTGARVSEITGLLLEDLRLDGPHRRITVHAKGNRERSVPIGDPTVHDGGDCIRALRAYLREREAFFADYPHRRHQRLLLTWQGFPLTSNGAEDVVRRLGWSAGVQDAIPHRFRHTFATIYLTMYPGDETGLRAILGHVSRDVMRHYVHLAGLTVAERAGRVSPSQQWLRASPPGRHQTTPASLSSKQRGEQRAAATREGQGQSTRAQRRAGRGVR